MAAAASITWEGACKRYGSKTALRPLNLKIGGGGVTAVLGENGAGKTTLIGTALGLVKPSRGRVQVAGEKAGTMAARKHCGAVLQQAGLPPSMTAPELLELQAASYDRPANLRALIERMDLTGIEGKAYRKLSGGQQRRVQVALAMAGQPDILFLDEPTTGLDTDARRRLWDIVREDADHRTVVLTTHYLEEAENLADRIVVLKDGAVIADETSEDMRRWVGGSLISCMTALNRKEIEGVPGVNAVRASGRSVEILANDAAQVLRELLRMDEGLAELTVKKPTLEDALATLHTNGGGS